MSSIEERSTGMVIPTKTTEAPDSLLALAHSRPRDALVAARALLSSDPDAYAGSIAHQTIAIVLRDRGDVATAIKQLRRALDLAVASGHPEREAEVGATLGVALAWAGRMDDSLASFARSLAIAQGGVAGRVLMRRAAAYRSLGRYGAALDDLQKALPLLRRAHDEVWEARTVMHRAETYLALGDTTRAATDYLLAERLCAASGQELEHAMARHNLGRVALARGDLPTALTYLDEAERRYDALDAIVPELPLDRCTTLLAAGLATDAMREADAAVASMHRRGGDALRTADLIFAAARAAMAVPDAQAAKVRGERARRAFRRQGRDLADAQAELVVLDARFRVDPADRALRRRADDLAARLDRFRDPDALHAHLTAGRVALYAGRTDDAERHFDVVARTRRRGSALARSVGWLGQALAAQTRGSARGTFAACGRGLDVLDEHRLTLGATELRASSTAHGAELAQLALRQAVALGDTRRLLLWSERWRATTLTLAPTLTPGSGEDGAGDLAALRATTRALAAATASAGDGPPERSDVVAGLDQERRRLEARVRARAMRTTGRPGGQHHQVDLGELIEQLGATQLVELIEVDRQLHVVTIVDGRLRRHTLGEVPDQEVRTARAMLAAIGLGQSSRHAAMMLAQIGGRLERLLLGPARDDLGDGPVLVVPTGRFQATPWSLLPVLRPLTVTVAPSALAWLRATKTVPPTPRRIALVVGPGLGSAGAEVPLLAQRYPGATVLAHGDATAERTLAALDGAWLAHIAAHGTFRADNPLFSALRMDDGPLNVHDLERLHRAPYRIVLSACDSGVGAPLGADELLGLVSSLIALGAGGVLASVVPVNDQTVVALMVAVHAALADGAGLGQALLTARAALGDDPVDLATGLSFTAFGA